MIMALIKPNVMTDKKIANYVPISEIEDLLLRAKHALKEEAKIWHERSQIERDYAKSLKEWSAKNIKNVEVNSEIEHSPVRVGMIVSMRECQATVALHEKVADLLSGTRGPSYNLAGYRTKHFKTDLDFDMTLFKKRGRVLQYFETYLGEYRAALKDCLKTIKEAELATKEEFELRKQIENKKAKVAEMKKGYGKSMHYRDKILKAEKAVIDLEGFLATASSKKSQALNRAKQVLNAKADILEEKAHEIAQWEVDRIKYVSYQYGVALDHLSLLGPEASESCKKANEVLARINPEQIVDDWFRSKISKLAIDDINSNSVEFQNEINDKEADDNAFRSSRRREQRHRNRNSNHSAKRVPIIGSNKREEKHRSHEENIYASAYLQGDIVQFKEDHRQYVNETADDNLRVNDRHTAYKSLFESPNKEQDDLNEIY